MIALDTTPDADALQFELLRRAGGGRRLQMACTMSDGVRQLTRSGIARRHPEYTEDDVDLALRRVLLGDELFQRLWPDAPLQST